MFRRTIDLRTPARSTTWQRVLPPPFVCLAPTSPALDPTVALPALVEAQFQRVVVLRASTRISPAPDTLVQLPTRFVTTDPESYDIPLTILGRSIVIRASTRRWTWQYGDGTTARTSTPGRHGYTEHTYQQTGTLTVRADLTWTGTWTLDGGAPRPIVGTVTTTGQPATVTVKQARAQLVAPTG